MNLLKSTGFLTALILVCARAGACPDCTLQSSGGIIEPQVVASKMAFSASTLMMIGVFFAVLAFMFWMMVRTCRELARERSISSVREA